MMKHNFKTKFMLFLLIAFLLVSSTCMASDIAPISATNATIDNANSVESTYNMITSDVYEFDQDVVIDSVIDGNAFAFGNNITITGEIGGDVFAFGNTITVAENAYVHGSIFVFGNQFTMNGICYGIYGGMANFTLGEKAIVARDIRVAADKVAINGQIKRNAFVSADNISFAESVTELITGNLEYSAPSEANFDHKLVGGEVKFTKEISSEATIAEKISSFITSTISALLYALAVVLLAIWLAPNFKNKIGNMFAKKAPLSLGVGLLASVCIVIGAFMLLFLSQGFGAGISVAAVTIFILAFTISQTVFSMGCAKLAAEKLGKDNLPMFIGLTLLFVFVLRLIGLIPFIGGFVGFLVSMTGLGMIIVHLIFKDKNEKIVTEVNE